MDSRTTSFENLVVQLLILVVQWSFSPKFLSQKHLPCLKELGSFCMAGSTSCVAVPGRQTSTKENCPPISCCTSAAVYFYCTYSLSRAFLLSCMIFCFSGGGFMLGMCAHISVVYACTGLPNGTLGSVLHARSQIQIVLGFTKAWNIC